MTGREWVFDPLPPSGAIVGGTAANYVFAPTLDIFVREVLQNAHDQRLPRPGRAEVDIDVVDLTGAHRRRLLDAVAFEQLGVHLEGTAREGYKLGSQVRDALARLEDPATFLRILRVTDRDTVGLSGGEDEKGTNFNGLCRDVLVNTDSSAGKGGSYGLGKAVLWRFSALSTVLFTSTIIADDRDQPGGTRLRAFGRADLAHHTTPSGDWAGPGWFGVGSVRRGGRRAESLWDGDAAELAAALGGHRPGSTRTGSTVAVLAFSEPGSETVRDAAEVAADLAAAADQWFWPAMTRDPASIAVTVGIERDGEEVERLAIAPFEGANRALVETAAATGFAEHAVVPGETARRQLRLVVPARRDKRSRQIEATVELRVRRAGEDDEEQFGANRVALVRGAGMVVDHRRPRRAPTDGGSYHAVLLCGLARGGRPEDAAVEAFLRAAEPPAHNRWVHDTDMVRANYLAGSRKQLEALWRAVDDALVEIADPEVPASEPGPPELAKLFAIGSTGPAAGNDHHFDVRPLTHQLTDDTWTIELRARRMRSARAWRLDLSVWLDAESGRGEPMTVRDLTADVPAEIARLAPHHLNVDLGMGDDEAALTLTVPLNGRSARAVRSRLRIDARPSLRETPS